MEISLSSLDQLVCFEPAVGALEVAPLAAENPKGLVILFSQKLKRGLATFGASISLGANCKLRFKIGNPFLQLIDASEQSLDAHPFRNFIEGLQDV